MTTRSVPLKWEASEALTSKQKNEERDQRDPGAVVNMKEEGETSGEKGPRHVGEREQQQIPPAKGIDGLQMSYVKK